MDYYYDEFKTDRVSKKAYWDDKEVQVDIENLYIGSNYKIMVPVMDMHTVEKSDEWGKCLGYPDAYLNKWLWRWIRDRNEDLISSFTFELSIRDRDLWDKVPYYYLNTPIFDEDIVVTRNKVTFRGITEDHLLWIRERGFSYGETKPEDYIK